MDWLSTKHVLLESANTCVDNDVKNSIRHCQDVSKDARDKNMFSRT